MHTLHFVSVLALAVAFSARAQPSLMTVCHVDDGGEVMPLRVAAAAIPGHLGHGDVLPGEVLDGVLYDAACEPVDECQGPVTTSDLVGEWSTFGEWPIHLSLVADGTMERWDWVWYCPEGVLCAWTGAVVTEGAWTLSGATVSLTVDSQWVWATPPEMAPALPDLAVPEALEVDSCGGTPVLLEQTPSGVLAYQQP